MTDTAENVEPTVTKDVAVELFQIKTRGALAAAFTHAEIVPDAKQWAMLRGEVEITMRDLGEISFDTVMNFSLHMVSKSPASIRALKEGE